MFRPKEMERSLIIGPKNKMADTVETLHSLKLIHILDFEEPDENFKLGPPLKKASEISENLIKLRSMSNILDIKVEKNDEKEVFTSTDIRSKILALELNINEEQRSKKDIEELLRNNKTQIELLRPFACLDLPFEYYYGYRNIAVFVGSSGKPLDDIESITKNYELVTKDNLIALFVPNQEKDRIDYYLSDKKFSPIAIPDEKGDPKEIIASLEKQKEKLELRFAEVRERLANLKKKHANFILETEKYLTLEIEKAEAPLRFATTEHCFVIDGWIPKDDYTTVSKKLSDVGGGDLYIQIIEPEKSDTPVLLDNPKLSRPFEFLLHLYSTPNYKELDPTVIMSIVFSIFFGFMIGDAGFGLLMILLGYFLWKKLWKIMDMPAFKEMGLILILGGVFAIIFGLFLYGEFFVIPFQSVENAAVDVGSWSQYLGINIPLHPVIHKLENIVDLFLISIIAAVIHLGIGYLFGIRNEMSHNKKHAIAKLGWLIILIGIFMEIMLVGQNTRTGGFVVNNVVPFTSWFSFDFNGLPISTVSIVFIIFGIVMFLPAEGLLALPEVVGLAANMLSYTRLAGIAVAKAAVAIAVTKMLIMALQSGNILLIVILGFLILMLYALVFVLGAIAAGIQALRLNYVEFFMKFYKGSGTRFKPFGKKEVSELNS
jgi:V/A-type H+-transporting ATPase subunit I